jgi:hypothetical protein
MKFFDWLGRKLNPPEGVKKIDLSTYRDEAADAVLLDVYAMFTAVQLIANLLSGCEFRTFYGKAVLDDAVLWAKDLKDRYTVLWLAYALGIKSLNL